MKFPKKATVLTALLLGSALTLSPEKLSAQNRTQTQEKKQTEPNLQEMITFPLYIDANTINDKTF